MKKSSNVYDILKNELQYETNKYVSFQNRCQIIIMVISIILLYGIKEISISNLCTSVFENLNFLKFIKIISGISFYSMFILIIINLCYVLSSKQMERFLPNEIDKKTTDDEIIEGIKSIIITNRAINRATAKKINISLFYMILFIIDLILYINI